MKIIFAGPSLPDATHLAGKNITVRPPAVQGDILKAVQDGARVIGLVDGGFEYTASVWHKEILFGLSNGVAIYGAASMGALRAAECVSLGMIGVGTIFDCYQSGELIDDADVALLHGPQELGYPVLTVAMVNVMATLTHGVDIGALSPMEARSIEARARVIFYKDRTWCKIFQDCVDIAIARSNEIACSLPSFFIDQKRIDANKLLQAVANQHEVIEPVEWAFHKTTLWRDCYQLYK